VARNNTALFANTDKIPDFVLNTIYLHPNFFSAAKYAIHVGSITYAWVQAMEMYDGYFKRAFHARLSPDASGNLLCNLDLDILKVVVIDRHHGSENRGVGFVRGFGLRKGAIACTTNCENQNLVVIGTNDEEIAFAARAIDSLGGGYVTVADGKLLASVKLDVAGCMSSAKWEDVRDQSLVCDEAAKSLGCGIQAPFLIASFVGLNGVPDLGLTEKGLIDCQAQELIDVVLSEEEVGDVGSLAEYPVSAPVKVCCRCPSHASDIHRIIESR
jgi:adenine deaminase